MVGGAWRRALLGPEDRSGQVGSWSCLSYSIKGSMMHATLRGRAALTEFGTSARHSAAQNHAQNVYTNEHNAPGYTPVVLRWKHSHTNMRDGKKPDPPASAKMAADKVRHDVERAVDRFRDHVETGLRTFCGNGLLGEWVGRERAKAQAMQRVERVATDIIRTSPLAKISVTAVNPLRADDNAAPRTVVSDAKCTLASGPASSTAGHSNAVEGSGSSERDQDPAESIMEAFNVGEMASMVAASSKAVVGHAQESLENAQENWSSLLAGQADVNRDGANGMGGFRLSAPVNGGLEAMLKDAEQHFGALWGSTTPESLFKMDQIDQHGKCKDSRDPSQLNEAGRSVTIFTTAGLPWMTGTAVNPLLRAHFLADPAQDRKVTIFIPWLNKADQKVVFPHNMTFESPEGQEQYVRDWVEKRTGQSSDRFNISFYPGRYAPEKGSILPVGDITEWVPDHQADVAVLEEPEHLTWYHHGKRWTDKFQHVVGVMHTNYLDYARREEGGAVKAAVLRLVNGWVCRAHCHKVIKLSDAVQDLPRQCTQFVHGVSPQFLEVGVAKAEAARARGDAEAASTPGDAAAEAGSGSGSGAVWPRGAYFLGKVVWAKGYTELLDLLQQHKQAGHELEPINVYGSGADKGEVVQQSQQAGLPIEFHDATDHAGRELQDYKVFVNPSLSDVVATTSAEALAMGKFLVCAEHPSNAFFSTFKNCITYRTPEEFSEKLGYAMANEPAPMTDAELQRLTWKGATTRFLEYAAMAPAEQPGWLERTSDNVAAAVHNTLTGVEMLRINAGAGAATLHTPKTVTDYTPSESESGGFFDNKERVAAARKAG